MYIKQYRRLNPRTGEAIAFDFVASDHWVFGDGVIVTRDRVRAEAERVLVRLRELQPNFQFELVEENEHV